jgi:hypothetical protein
VQVEELLHFFLAADGLPHFERDEFANHPLPEHQRQQERGEECGACAEAVVMKDIQELPDQGFLVNRVPQFCEPVHHADSSWVKTCSMPAERLPFNNTASPSFSHCRR